MTKVYLMYGIIMILENEKNDSPVIIDIDRSNEKLHDSVSGIEDDVIITSLQRFGNIYKKWERIIDEQHVA